MGASHQDPMWLSEGQGRAGQGSLILVWMEMLKPGGKPGSEGTPARGRGSAKVQVQRAMSQESKQRGWGGRSGAVPGAPGHSGQWGAAGRDSAAPRLLRTSRMAVRVCKHQPWGFRAQKYFLRIRFMEALPSPRGRSRTLTPLPSTLLTSQNAHPS